VSCVVAAAVRVFLHLGGRSLFFSRAAEKESPASAGWTGLIREIFGARKSESPQLRGLWVQFLRGWENFTPLVQFLSSVFCKISFKPLSCLRKNFFRVMSIDAINKLWHYPPYESHADI
jgi:hypothetical protein